MFYEIVERAKRGKFPQNKISEAVLYLDPIYTIAGGLKASDIVLCHDIGPISHPELYSGGIEYSVAYEYIQKTGPGMVFVSEASRTAFCRRYGEAFRFLKTIPLYTRTGALAGDCVRPAGLAAPFFLCVGAMGSRKNQRRLIEAFHDTGLAAEGHRLVLVGTREFGFDGVLEAQRRAPGVELLPYASDAELRWLYAHTTAFCLPSLLEGFGMPALEAASHRAVTIVSEGGALAEAIGSHGLLVDPTQTASIARALRHAVEMDETSRARLQEDAFSFSQTLTRQRFLDAWAGVIDGAEG